jgi:hypothetical protein
MAAIALAESGGIAGNTNPTDNGGTQTSWGLWQISDGTHGWSYGGDPYDPINNERVALQKYHGQGLGAWGTYTSGAYRQFLRGNVPPSSSIPSGSQAIQVANGTQPSQTQTPQQAQFASFAGFPIPNPALPGADVIESVVTNVAGLSSGGFGWAIGAVKTANDAMKSLSKSLGDIANVFNALLWLVNPAHLLRVFSGLTGIVVLGIALYFIATA